MGGPHLRSHPHYLTYFRGRIPHVGAFWVSGSGFLYGGMRTEIEHLAGRVTLATESFSEREVRTGAASAKLLSLAETINRLRETKTAPTDKSSLVR